jgi:hypothetical protein
MPAASRTFFGSVTWPLLVTVVAIAEANLGIGLSFFAMMASRCGLAPVSVGHRI